MFGVIMTAPIARCYLHSRWNWEPWVRKMQTMHTHNVSHPPYPHWTARSLFLDSLSTGRPQMHAVTSIISRVRRVWPRLVGWASIVNSVWFTESRGCAVPVSTKRSAKLTESTFNLQERCALAKSDEICKKISFLWTELEVEAKRRGSCHVIVTQVKNRYISW